ncbi:Gfo/Idh/MocA family oxidoreductase [Bradyrhizobium sp. 62]|uniref:Gfo/Idh/MocA family oxidoreductase n=1 Tax=Bradyrhizobium sp. 62 TaxID=1043588 RepID=UPI001FF97E71|nr:Gfo/Idh/MocA family oxidoreductase [Bradyrhizobium sp. 62]MCK1366886.1 Gfo/Idh/MocA family oxidoreductase [Bradyrhizobium sp. 62]
MTNPVLKALGHPFRLGIVGGAPPSMIGPVHRLAATMDQRFALVAGMLSSRAERSRAEGAAIGLPEARCYDNIEEFLANERAREDGIEALAIVTPNDTHAPYLRLALAAGLDVMMEKPLCNELREARELRDLVASSGCAVAVTHTYSGYPMVREMRARCRADEIGTLRLVQIEYLAGGLATAVELGPDAEQRWRLKPERSGPSLVLGDIGTHAHHLVSFVTGRSFETVSADVGAMVPGRAVHDIAQVRFHLADGVRGQLEVSNAAAGMSNQIRLRVYGDSGHMEWQHGRHNELRIASLSGDVRIISGGQPTLGADAQHSSRLMRPGHPEGLQEAVANLYCDLADMMLARRGHPTSGASILAPRIEDGVAGLAFVMACLESSAKDGAMVRLSK